MDPGPRIIHDPPEYREAVRREVGPVLGVIADVTGNPGVRRALVGPKSAVGHFFYDPTWDAAALCARIAARLGVPVAPGDTLVAVARRVAELRG